MENIDPIDKVNSYIWDTAIIPREYVNAKWCKKSICPVIGDLQKIVELAREDVDRTLLKEFSSMPYIKPIAHFRHPSRYPEGYCLDITEKVYSRLNEDNSNEPVIKLINFAKEKTFFKRVFCIKNGATRKSFQNAIQLGDIIIDAAADTGKKRDVQKVRIWPVDENPFKQIWFFEDYASVKSTYHTQRIYSTYDNLPWLAPIMPALAVGANNSIEFLDHKGLFFRNLVNDLRLSRRFLDSNLYEKEPLPIKVRDFLRKTCKEGIFKYVENHSFDREQIFDSHINYWKDIFDKKIDYQKRQDKLDIAENFLLTMEKFDHYSQWYFNR